MFDELGETPDQVANSFRALGIRGIRNTVRFLNPLVRYAHTVIQDGVAMDIILGDRLRIDYGEGRITDIPVPAPVRQFLDLFHKGKFPDLELPVGPDGTVVTYICRGLGKFIPHVVKPSEIRQEQMAAS